MSIPNGVVYTRVALVARDTENRIVGVHFASALGDALAFLFAQRIPDQFHVALVGCNVGTPPALLAIMVSYGDGRMVMLDNLPDPDELLVNAVRQ